MDEEGDGPEFFTLLLGATLGMCFMASTTNLLMIFMAVEMASLPSYVLSGFRKTDRVGSEASLKYVLFGAATSAVMVYGMSMLYGLFGTLQLEEIAAQLRGMTLDGVSVPLIVGVAGLIVGIGFKISAVPFHFWCPDVFEGAGVDVSVFLSVASKGAGISLLLRVVMTLAHGAGYDPASPVLTGTAIAIGVLGAITATVGNTGALVQNNIKRLLAYSSIAHAGYILCALSLLVKPTSSAAAPAGVVSQAVLLYLAVYLFMNLGAFTVAGLIYRQTASEDIRDYAGLGRRNPVLALSMAACMVSLIGLPPLAGFAAKFYLMYVLAHGWWWLLVAVIGINTIVSLYYYVRVLRVMYLVDSDEPPLSVNPVGGLISAACGVMLVLMLVLFSPLLKLTGQFGKLHVPQQQATTPREPPATQPTVADAR
jgi:NADH-quinone oxidoreductase subunit N